MRFWNLKIRESDMGIGILVLLLVGIIFFPWFAIWIPLSSGDWPYLFTEQIREFFWVPEARFLWLAPYYQILTKIVVQNIGIPWEVAEKLLWFFPFIIISVVVSYKAFRSWIAVLVYTTNTYILMIVGGGQMGVSMAYALAPLVFTRISILSVAIQAMFDPRITLLTLVAAVVIHRPKFKKLLFVTFGAGIIHLYWIIPIIQKPEILQERLAQVSTGILEFLSFATFSQTISLLHPNWPENIFGKVYFMQPEFLLIPILAFLSFVGNKRKELVPYGLLAIIGAFLAKGTQDPFGGIYEWLFTYVPGFWLFRDSTKFYLFVALAYAYLIPKSKVPAILIVFVWALLIRQALTHELTGTFQPQPIEPEYVALKNLIVTLPEGAPTHWVPAVSRYAFSTATHPALVFERTANGLVIVPWDSRGEIFLTDRKYDDELRQKYIASMSALLNLQRDPTFTKLAVWKIK